jgi:hypothetical protein
MNRMFQKVLGVALVASLGVFVAARTQEPEKKHHEPPAARQPIPLEREGTPAKQPPPKDVVSEPTELSPIARAIISTNEGEEVPKFWPAGVPLTLTSIRSNAGDLIQSRQWEVFPLWVDKYSNRGPGNRMISIATGTKAKTIKVTLYVAKSDTFDKQTVIISIKPDPLEPGNDDRPTPPPGPDEPPVPPDVPPVPPLSATGKQVHDLAIRDIPDIGSHKAQVQALAKSHLTIADQITQAVAGVPAYESLKTPEGIVAATQKSNRAAVGAERQMFVPFFTSLNNEVLKPLVPTTLSTANGHIQVWKDIAAGLYAAAGPATRR